MGQLSVTRIRTLTEPGRYPDGDGLTLNVGSAGARSWVLRAQSGGTRRDYGLGSFKTMSLAEAREAATLIRKQLSQGIDPIAERKKARDVIPTFQDAAAQVHAEHKAGWKNGKHQAQWLTTLENYAFPALGDRLVSEIEGPAIRDVLAAVWLGSKLNQRVELSAVS